MKDSFVFRREWRDALSGLPAEVRLEVYEAIIGYGISGTLPTGLKPMAMLAFKFAKATLDRDAERYEETRRKRSEAGKKHKGNQYTNGTSVPTLEQNGTNGTNGTDSVYVIQESKDSMCINNPTLLAEGMSDSDAVPTHPKSFREQVLSVFNEKMAGKSIKPIKAITEGTQRADMLRARRREYGDDAIFRMIDNAASSRFLNGHNNRGFVATFDWLIKPNNFPKVLEGNYENDYEGNRTDNRAAGQRADEAAAIVARLAAENSFD